MFKIVIHILVVFSILFVVYGCGDSNPVESEEEHFEAIGLFILSDSDTLVIYEGGVVSGEIDVDNGDLTSLLHVEFLTEDGDIGLPPNDEWSMDWSIADTSFADLIANAVELQQYNFFILGKKVGTTTIKIIINHQGHKDFESKEIPIEVTP